MDKAAPLGCWDYAKWSREPQTGSGSCKGLATPAIKKTAKNMSKIVPQNHQKCPPNGPWGSPGERSWNLLWGLGKKTSILTRFWSILGTPGDSLGDPGGTHFRPWPSPGRPRGAQGANFKPSWANPFLDLDSGPQKSPKMLNFESARTSSVARSPRWELNCHIFTNFLPEP